MGLGATDVGVLVAYLGGVVVLGLLAGRRQRSVDDFLLGARSLPWWAVMGSIVATETSTASFLSLPGVSFVEGGDLRFGQLALGYLVGRVAVSALLLPSYFRGRIVSAYAVLGERFGLGTRRLASAVFLVARTLGDGLRLFLAALALDAIAGVGFTVSVLAVAGATTLYTVFGGMRSIVWNDCAQLLVYVLGGALLLGLAIDGVEGGWSAVVDFGRATGRWRFLDPSFDLSDPNTLWAGLIGGAFLTLGVHGTDQMLVQRYLSARSLASASRALVVSAVVVAAQFALFLTLGVALAAFFASRGGVDGIASDQAVARFVVDALPEGYGLVGLLLAAVLAASMSTLSSSLNSSASSLLEDWIRPARTLADGRALALTRGLTLGFAGLQVAVALVARGVSSSVVAEALAIAGFSAGLLLGLFALAHLVPDAGGRAATLALAVAVGVLSAVTFTPGLDLAWTWTPLIGSLTVLGAGRLAVALGRA
ncbi:MAG: sodium/solute symporter [Planctomycetota bacterium]